MSTQKVQILGRDPDGNARIVEVDADGHFVISDDIGSPPNVGNYTTGPVNLAAATANQVLIANPGPGYQIWVYGLFMMADTAAGTVALEDSTGAALSGVMAVSDEGGFVLPVSGDFSMPWIKVPVNRALRADTGACSIGGIITYALVGV